MTRITNAVLLERINNIKEDTEEIKEENTEQWKVINKQGQDIASQKSIIKIIEGFIVAIIGSIIAYFWKGQS